MYSEKEFLCESAVKLIIWSMTCILLELVVEGGIIMLLFSGKSWLLCLFRPLVNVLCYRNS